jgi:serine/threonine protein kinase
MQLAGLTCASLSARHDRDADTASTVRSAANRTRRWPKQVGVYELVRFSSAGGMGLVFEARSRVSGLPVALKFMDPDVEYPHKEERFSREVMALRQLQHPCTVRLLDFGQTPAGLHYLVMEYVPGSTLFDLVARQGALPARRALSILRQLCAALAEAHALGIVHRDIKPSNVMVERPIRGGDAVKLIDFGLVKLPGAAAEDDDALPGLFLGTPGYAPPEVWSNTSTGEARGDVYGVGLVAHHLLTGARPPDPVETLVYNSRRLIGELQQRSPAGLVELISRCLSVDPRSRFADAGALLRALPAA